MATCARPLSLTRLLRNLLSPGTGDHASTIARVEKVECEELWADGLLRAASRQKPKPPPQLEVNNSCPKSEGGREAGEGGASPVSLRGHRSPVPT